MVSSQAVYANSMINLLNLLSMHNPEFTRPLNPEQGRPPNPE